jgi:uncharacterized protein
MNSALYTGQLNHRRYAPRQHYFDYPLALIWLDLAELDQVFVGRWFWSTRRPNLVWFRRADYLGDPAVPLERAVRELVAQETGCLPTGPIRLLTQLRTMGHCFNPVSFYYCFDAGGHSVQAIVAEISNTPWKERHCYVLTGRQLHTAKRFHVSPFMPMNMDYAWHFTRPGRRLAIYMQNLQQGTRVFDATLSLTRSEITGASLARVLLRFPLPTMRVVFAIYWQAARLWLRKVPFYPHPAPLAAINGSETGAWPPDRAARDSQSRR